MKNSPNHHLIHYTTSLAKEGERQTAAGGCSTFSVEGRMSRARSPYFFTFHRTQQLRNWKKDGTRPGVCSVTVAMDHMLLLLPPTYSGVRLGVKPRAGWPARSPPPPRLWRGAGGGCWEGEGGILGRGLTTETHMVTVIPAPPRPAQSESLNRIDWVRAWVFILSNWVVFRILQEEIFAFCQIYCYSFVSVLCVPLPHKSRK